MFSTLGSVAHFITKTPACRIAVLVLGALLICACKPKSRVGSSSVIVTPPTLTPTPIPEPTPNSSTSSPTPTVAPSPEATPTVTTTATATPSATPLTTPAASPIATPTFQPLPSPEPTPSELQFQAENYLLSLSTQDGSSANFIVEFTLDPVGGVFNLSGLKTDEWLEYEVTIPNSGNYLFDARVASTNEGSQFRVLVDGVEKGSVMTIGNTGGGQSWRNVSTDLGALVAGERVVRIEIVSGDLNFNWFRLIEGEGEIQGRAWLPNDIASSSAIVQPVLTGLNPSDGAVGDDFGQVYFSEFTGEHRIWRIDTLSGGSSVYRASANYARGLLLDSAGRLLSAERGRIAVESSAGNWNTISAVADTDLKHLTRGAQGDLFFNDLAGGTVFYLDAAQNRSEYSGFNQSEGLVWDTERNRLYLALPGENLVRRYDVSQVDASLSNPQTFADVTAPTGLALDEAGNLYVVSDADSVILVFNSEGSRLGSIEVDAESLSNCAFGGSDRRSLFITAADGLRQIQLKIPGHRPD